MTENRTAVPGSEQLMAGVTTFLRPTIMKCDMGGWIVVIPGKGIAAKTELGEAMDFLAEQTFTYMNEPLPSGPPRFMHKMAQEKLAETEQEPDRPAEWNTPIRLPSMRRMASAIGVGLLAFLGVRAYS